MDHIDLEGKTYLAVPGHTAKPKYEFGTMTHFAYRVSGGEEGEELVVATTRLETMLGDSVRKRRGGANMFIYNVPPCLGI